MTQNEKRSNYPMPESEMYKLDDINDVIKKERRHDELDRLREVRQQKAVWLKTVLSALALVLVFLSMAIMEHLIK